MKRWHRLIRIFALMCGLMTASIAGMFYADGHKGAYYVLYFVGFTLVAGVYLNMSSAIKSRLGKED